VEVPHDAAETFDFAGRRALVTGGESGIPRATALLLAALGADVTVASIGDGLEDTVDVIHTRGRKGYGIHADLTDAAECRRVVEEAASAMGGLDAVVNAAGGSAASHTYDEWSPEDWDGLVDLNVRAAFFVSQAAIPHLVEAGGGAIVSVSSIASISPVPSVLPYGAAKAGINNMTMTLASEVGHLGVRVNAIAPGPTKSGRFLKLVTAGGRDPDEVAGPGTAMGRIGDPDEQAWPIVFLLSPAAGYINGVTLHVDGGRNAR
jgi:NAD(P)-dependent dehydrogenase (short-subunit alcohol dehydrogenase family)